MTNYSTFLLLIMFSTVFFNACSTGRIYIDRTASFDIADKSIKHIVSVSPNFSLPATLDPTIADKRPVLSGRDAIWFYQNLTNNAKNHGIHLQIEGAAEMIEGYDSNYFNYLAPLKREILQVLSLQDFSDVNKHNNLQPAKNYQNGLIISSHYSHLAEKYGTPYFAIQGISFVPKNENGEQELLLAAALPTNDLSFVTANVETVYYTVIVDVSLSQIVYREFRVIKINSNQKQFNSIIDDSFSTIVK
ncbi:MAG: hypothetical protein AB8G11_23210 [Saprospiraceae bacterium]